MDPFDAPLFDVWKAKTSVNAVKHPGNGGSGNGGAMRAPFLLPTDTLRG